MSRREARRPRRSQFSSGRQPIYAVTGFTGANYYATAGVGGESGIDTGFGSVAFIVPDTLTGARFLQGRSNNSGSNGHLFFLSGAGLFFICGSGAAAAVQAPSYTFTSAQVGRPAALMGWHDGTKVRLAVNTFPQQADGTAITGFTAHANAFTTSGVSGTPVTAPATGTRYIGGLTWRGTPTNNQLQELLNIFNATWRVPTPAQWAHATITHRWSVNDALAGSVKISGQTGPASIADTVTGAGADALVRNGTPTLSLVGYR